MNCQEKALLLSSPKFVRMMMVLVLVHATVVQATVDLGIQGITPRQITKSIAQSQSRCRLGTSYQPSTCTNCLCGPFNLLLCRQQCPGAYTSTPRPSAARPTGQTIVPILLPINTLLNRLPRPR